MSSSELKFYFGVHSAEGIDSHSYEVAQVIERHSVEKRSGIDSEAAALSFSLSAFGKNFDLNDLLPNDGLLASHAKVVNILRIEFIKLYSKAYIMLEYFKYNGIASLRSCQETAT